MSTGQSLRCYDCTRISTDRCINLGELPSFGCPDMIDYNITEEVETVCVKAILPNKEVNRTTDYTIDRFCGLTGPDHIDSCKKFLKYHPVNSSCYTCSDDNLCNSAIKFEWKIIWLIFIIAMNFAVKY